MRLIQICIVAIAKKASKQAEIRSHRTTRRRYLQGRFATGHVCTAFRQENAFLLCNVSTVVYRHENCCNF